MPGQFEPPSHIHTPLWLAHKRRGGTEYLSRDAFEIVTHGAIAVDLPACRAKPFVKGLHVLHAGYSRFSDVVARSVAVLLVALIVLPMTAPFSIDGTLGRFDVSIDAPSADPIVTIPDDDNDAITLAPVTFFSESKGCALAIVVVRDSGIEDCQDRMAFVPPPPADRSPFTRHRRVLRV